MQPAGGNGGFSVVNGGDESRAAAAKATTIAAAQAMACSTDTRKFSHAQAHATRIICLKSYANAFMQNMHAHAPQASGGLTLDLGDNIRFGDSVVVAVARAVALQGGSGLRGLDVSRNGSALNGEEALGCLCDAVGRPGFQLALLKVS